MPSPFPIRARVVGGFASLGLVLLAGCGDREGRTTAPADGVAAAPSGDSNGGTAGPGTNDATAAPVAELAPLLARAAAPGALPEAERLALEQAMQRLLLAAPSTCDGCLVTVSYVDQAAGGDHFRCELRTAGGEPAATLDVFYRPDLPAGAAAGWARAELAGHPASGLPGEALFVWPGRFEIRAFARTDSLRSDQRLAGLLEGLPLDVLARL